MAWGGYTDRLGNLDLDVIGAADSLTGDAMLRVMLRVMLIVVVGVGVVVVVLLSAWIGVGYELLEDGDNRAMIEGKKREKKKVIQLTELEQSGGEEKRYREGP